VYLCTLAYSVGTESCLSVALDLEWKMDQIGELASWSDWDDNPEIDLIVPKIAALTVKCWLISPSSCQGSVILISVKIPYQQR